MGTRRKYLLIGANPEGEEWEIYEYATAIAALGGVDHMYRQEKNAITSGFSYFAVDADTMELLG